ncbi:MAG: DUF1573 domain-containing protein [Candidatus Omnitrophica bacterium]|nr:DUF1573 domain-containing protein [Candidatus Omnitrophota bacterium]MDD5593073.1 DUF1573 domain-containing protein [Candidatus Omnitrophota bacterium]
MRRIFLFLVFFPLILGGCAQSRQNLLAPLQTADNYSWDFGKRQEGEVLKHAFTFKNDSKQTIKINEVNTSCGCTVSKVEKKVLLSGEATAIEVQFNTKGYSGSVQQYVYVHTDDFDNPVLRFIIKAEIVK